MSLPHFPSIYVLTDKERKAVDDGIHSFMWYQVKAMKEWKLEHERRLTEFFEWLESFGMGGCGIMLTISEKQRLIYEKKKGGLK